MTARTQARNLAQSALDATRRREERGAAPVSDTLQAATALAKAALTEQRAVGDRDKALSVLVYSMGLPTTTQLTLAEGAESPQAQAVSDLAQWLAQAQEQHPAIGAARAQWEAAKARVSATRAEGLPTIDLTGNYYQNGYPNQGLQPTRTNVTTVGVTLTIPLFEGFARGYKVRGAEAQVDQSEAQWRDTEHQVLTDVVKAHADAVSSLANLQSSASLLAAAEAALASSEKRYSKGAADILELLAV